MKKLIVVAALAFLSGGLFAVDQTDYTQWVTLTNSDSASNPRVNSFAPHGSSITNYWSDGCLPSADKSYYVPAGRILMTTTGSKGNATFAGGQLAVGGEVQMRGGPGYLNLGGGARLLPGACIRFLLASGPELRTVVSPIALESTVEQPARIILNPVGLAQFVVNATFTGEEGTALAFTRRTDPSEFATYLLQKDAFADYAGTVIVSTNAELAVSNKLAAAAIPGRLLLDRNGRLFTEADGADLTVGTLEIADGAMMKWDFTTDGVANEVVVTDAFVVQDGAKLTVQFGTWYPKTGVQKYPIIRLTGAAAASEVSADDFVLDFSSALWLDMPRTDNPRVVLDGDGGDVVISVEWPDEPEPTMRAGSNGEIILCGSDPYRVVDALADGAGAPLSVVKEGTGTWLLGPNCSFTGSIKVDEGKLIVGNPYWEYYRWVIKATYNTVAYDAPTTDQGSATRVAGIKSFGLFDSEGNDRLRNLTDEGDWELHNGFYRSFQYSKPLQQGHFRLTTYEGAYKSFRGLNTQYEEEPWATNLFNHVAWDVPNFWCNEVQKHPGYFHSDTWIVFTMRPLPGNPITNWDYVNTWYKYNYQFVSNCTLEASMALSTDAADWTEIGSVDNPQKPTLNTWQGTGEEFVADYDTHTGGMPIERLWPSDPVPFVIPQVSVAQGATLTANADEPLVISDLLIDYEKGLGTISNFAFAESGTLRITNTYGRSALHFAADLSGVQGLDNLKNWTILIDGMDRTARRVLTVTADGIHIDPKGLLLLIGSAGGSGDAPTYLTEPERGAMVPLLTVRQKAFLQMTPGEVCTAISNEVDGLVAEALMLKKIRSTPEPVTFRWRSGLGKVTVTVAKKGAETTPFFRSVVTTASVSVSNLEVGTRYVVTLDGEAEHETREFVTEDLAPRCIGLSGRTNTRDMGGRTLPNGRRVRQGLLYRTGQFDNAGELSVSEETRRYIVETLGVKTDIDLRQDEVVQPLVDAGRVSPLGPTVEWIHEWDNYHDYASVHTTGADATARIFRYMMNPEKYPMVFHCAGGADRTGTLASLVHGVLGASDEQIWMDYLITSWAGAINQKRYPAWFLSFVRSFDKFEGATLSERICNYFKLTLGFTEDDLNKIRDILLEPAK